MQRGDLIPIKLSKEELNLIIGVESGDKSRMNILRSPSVSAADSVTVYLDRDTIEGLRSKLTEQLAKSGFDKDYNLTVEGRIVEDLIDRLFVP